MLNRSFRRSMIILLTLSSILIGAGTIIRSSAASIQTNLAGTGAALGEPPVAIIGFPNDGIKIDATQVIRFDAGTSYDPEGGDFTYLWEIDPYVESWGFPANRGNPETRWAFQTRIGTPGNYTITLTVTDDEGLTDTQLVHVEVKRESGSVVTDTTALTTIETTSETKATLSVRPNFLPGFSILLAIFALFLPVILKRRMKR